MFYNKDTHRVAYFDIIDFVKNEKYNLKPFFEVEEYVDEIYEYFDDFDDDEGIMNIYNLIILEDVIKIILDF